ncbi:hypothetical protein BH24CHL4_BH24CHL4_15830 [soil metagenome]
MTRSRLGFRLALLSLAVSLIGALSSGVVIPQFAAASSDDALIFSELHRSLEVEDPDFGPLSGTLTVSDNEPVLNVVGSESRDLAVRVTCLLRVASAETPSDCGIAFRRNAGGQSLLLTVTGNGAWAFGRTGEEPIQTGESNVLADRPGGALTVELFAIGLTGYAGLNGAYLASLDLSLIPSSGALAIGSGFASSGSRSGQQMDFQDLSIWSFDNLVLSVVPSDDDSGLESEFETVVQTITADEPLVGPQEGRLIHTEGQATFSRTGVQATDLVVHLECGPPSTVTIELWDCGIVFRLGEAVDDQFRLILLSTGRWILAKGASTTIQDGFFEPPTTESGARLQIDLVAAGEIGWLGINGSFAGALDLALLRDPGDVAAASAFFASTYVPGGSTSFQQFAVWEANPGAIDPLLAPRPATTPPPLDPADDSDARLFAVLMEAIASERPEFGPESGVMRHDPSSITLLSSSLELENLAARLQCAAPQDAGSRLWDCGIVWRSNGSDAQLRLAVVSDGFWSLRTGAAQVIAEGSGLPIDNTPGSFTTLELLALGNEGFFAVNDAFVARLDLSPVPGAGEILAGTAFFSESYADGGTTRYDQFSVWPLASQSGAPVTAETPIPAVASPIPDPGTTMETLGSSVDIASASPIPGSPLSIDDIRAMEPSNQARALLKPLDGQEIHGYGVATRKARTIDVSILIANAGPGDLVALQSGVCGQLSTNLLRLEQVGALNEQGIIVTTLPLRLTEFLNPDTYSMVVYAAVDKSFTNPLACGELVAK